MIIKTIISLRGDLIDFVILSLGPKMTVKILKRTTTHMHAHRHLYRIMLLTAMHFTGHTPPPEPLKCGNLALYVVLPRVIQRIDTGHVI